MKKKHPYGSECVLHSDVMYICLAAAPDSDLWTCFQKNCMLKDVSEASAFFFPFFFWYQTAKM